jgi:hypothetical protein
MMCVWTRGREKESGESWIEKEEQGRRERVSE